VRRLLGGSTSVTDNFSKKVDDLLTPMVQADGTLDQTIKSQDAQRRAISDQIARMDLTLAKKQDSLKKQFAAMEAALQASQAQGQWLSGQLNALNNRR
jgi:flagellar capping protein FliD